VNEFTLLFCLQTRLLIGRCLTELHSGA
jgi:hypothetical protein